MSAHLAALLLNTHTTYCTYVALFACRVSFIPFISFWMNFWQQLAEDKFPVWFTYLASKADYSLHVSPSSLSASHKHPLAPVQPLMCNVQHVCNQGNNWLEALWSDEPTGSSPLIGSILRQETIKEPFLPPADPHWLLLHVPLHKTLSAAASMQPPSALSRGSPSPFLLDLFIPLEMDLCHTRSTRVCILFGKHHNPPIFA